jgi:hypothetical protein
MRITDMGVQIRPDNSPAIQNPASGSQSVANRRASDRHYDGRAYDTGGSDRRFNGRSVMPEHLVREAESGALPFDAAKLDRLRRPLASTS